MASISPPHHLSFLYRKRQIYPYPPPQQQQSPQPPFSSLSKLVNSDTTRATTCRCSNSSSSPSSSGGGSSGWDVALQSLLKDAMKQFDSFMNSFRDESNQSVEEREVDQFDGVGGDEGEWDWERWRRHFEEVDDRERLVSVLKSQLGQAVRREDYKHAARLKVAIAAAAANDTVGRVVLNLNRAVEEERYLDAAFLRDNAGAGLVGWWCGISEDVHDHYGLIIRVTAEHGRYVARNYSPRQLATAAVGVPVFEIFVTMNDKGEYKYQAVYLRRKGLLQGPSRISAKASGSTASLNPAGPSEDNSDLIIMSADEPEDGDDAEDGSDLTEGLPGFKNILRDMIPGMKVKVLKVTATSRVDKDFIAKVIEQIMDEEDEEKDIELEISEAEDEIKGENDLEKDEIEMDAGNEVIDEGEQSEISVKVVIGDLAQKHSGSVSMRESLRVPAKLEKVGRRSFIFSIDKDVKQQDSSNNGQTPGDKNAKLQGQHRKDPVMFDLAKFIGKEKIPLKVLKDIGELINITLSQTQNNEPMSGSTTFHRLEVSSSADPLNGLYIGVHGLYSSEVIHLRRKLGQWKDDRGPKELSDLQFYEYVEAVKLTGDPYVPAGEVAFRAKVGKRYQLPHKGIIPEEFGVVARYKGQGRLAEPGYRNPRWVDGELVILDGKYIKGGPVVGFIYWAPEYHFLVFFNRLKLQ